MYGGNSKVANGTPVSVQDEESGKTIQGIICGSNGITEGTKEEYYVTTVGDRVYITQSLTDDSRMYYVKLDGNASVEDMTGSQIISYPLISYSDVYTIPADALYTEGELRQGDIRRFLLCVENRRWKYRETICGCSNLQQRTGYIQI